MSDPVGASAALSPRWLDAAHARAAEFGFGQDLAGLGEARWEALCQAVELTVSGENEPPAGWRTALARQAGRVSEDERRQNAADARLAARGEVFAVDDDA
jgi:hypothetical protein